MREKDPFGSIVDQTKKHLEELEAQKAKHLTAARQCDAAIKKSRRIIAAADDKPAAEATDSTAKVGVTKKIVLPVLLQALERRGGSASKDALRADVEARLREGQFAMNSYGRVFGVLLSSDDRFAVEGDIVRLARNGNGQQQGA